MLPRFRSSFTLNPLPLQRKCMKAASKHSHIGNIRAAGASQPTGKEKLLTLKSPWLHSFCCTANARLTSLPCKAHGQRRGHSQGITLLTHPPTQEPEEQRLLWPQPYHPQQLTPPRLCHGAKASVAAILPSLVTLNRELKCLLSIWQASLKQTLLALTVGTVQRVVQSTFLIQWKHSGLNLCL